MTGGHLLIRPSQSGSVYFVHPVFIFVQANSLHHVESYLVFWGNNLIEDHYICISLYVSILDVFVDKHMSYIEGRYSSHMVMSYDDVRSIV